MILRCPDPSIFLPLYKALIRSHVEYAIQASSPILSRDCQAIENFQKLTVKFVKGLRHVPYETALQRLQLFSLIRRRIRGNLICIYRIMHCFLDFPCDAVFAAPTRCSSPILEPAARGYCYRYIRGDIQLSMGRTMAVPFPRSSPLTRPPTRPPIFVPPYHIQPYVIGVIIFGRQ